MAERHISIVRREFTANEAEVEWTVTRDDGHAEDRSLSDDFPPSPEFHEAMDGLKEFIGAPYLVHQDSRRVIRPLRVIVSHKNDSTFVQLHGAFVPEGFNNPVHLHVPKQEAEGKLFTAVQAVIDAAGGYIDGERGEESLLGSNGDDADAE